MKVFVYGTLMDGLANHSVLKGAKCLGKATIQSFGLYCVTPSYPGIVPMMGAFVRGEVYQINKTILKKLDVLEGEGNLYSRFNEKCTMEDGTLQDVYVYSWRGAVNEEDYVRGDFTPWHPDSRAEARSGIGKTHFHFFAYGRYCNEREVRKLLLNYQIDSQVNVVGVGSYESHRLAFTRRKSNNFGALDLIPSEGDYALGVIYRLPKEALRVLDQKEGCPTCYERKAIKVRCGGKYIMVQAYAVVEKFLDEVAPDDEYYNIVREGMLDRYPISFINQYLITHCNKKFGFANEVVAEPHLYHQGRSKPLGYPIESLFAGLIRQMAIHLGNDNQRTEIIQPTPEMFRLLVKLIDMQLRDVLDYGYGIPREMTNHLAAEFERLTGLQTDRIPS